MDSSKKNTKSTCSMQVTVMAIWLLSLGYLFDGQLGPIKVVACNSASAMLRRNERSLDREQVIEILRANQMRNLRQQQHQHQRVNQLNPDLFNKPSMDRDLSKALANALIEEYQQYQQSADSPAIELLLNSQKSVEGMLPYGGAGSSSSNNLLGKLFESQEVDSVGPGESSADAGSNVQVVLEDSSKRSMKPCNFNAVSCAKNPYRRQ